VVAQVGHHRHALDAGFVAEQAQVGATSRYSDRAGQSRPAARVKLDHDLSGSMVILRPGMYTVDSRSRAMRPRSDSGRSPGPGRRCGCRCASRRGLGRDREGIVDFGGGGVVDGLNAARSASGRSGGSTGAAKAGKSVPPALRKYSNRKRPKVKSWVEASAPQANSRRAGDLPLSPQAASSALVSPRLRSGL
jgi:hypothetical protein